MNVEVTGIYTWQKVWFLPYKRIRKFGFSVKIEVDKFTEDDVNRAMTVYLSKHPAHVPRMFRSEGEYYLWQKRKR